MTSRRPGASHQRKSARLQRVIAAATREIGWRFDLMDAEHWPFPHPDTQEYAAFIDGLVRIGEIPYDTWDNPAHSELTTDLVQPAQDRLADLDLDAVAHGRLYKFKVSEVAEEARMWAIRRDNVYFLLWWDPRHEIEAPKSSPRRRRSS